MMTNVVNNKIHAITISKCLYGRKKYIISVVKYTKDKKGRDIFRVQYTMVQSNDKNEIRKEAVELSARLQVPFFDGIKNGMLVEKWFHNLEHNRKNVVLS